LRAPYAAMTAAGKVAGYEAQEVSSMARETESPASFIASSLPDSSLRSTTVVASIPSSEGTASIQAPGHGVCEVSWHLLRFGDQIHPFHKYAYCAGDIYLLDRFLELAGLPEIGGESVKLLLRALKFLRLCDYTVEDICSILAHASAYFEEAWALCGSSMDSNEVGNVLATLVFIAHCYVQDETCPLHIWHQHLFRKYCPLKTLNSAVIRLMHIRHFILRLTSEDLHGRLGRLQGALDMGVAAALGHCGGEGGSSTEPRPTAGGPQEATPPGPAPGGYPVAHGHLGLPRG